MGEMGETGERYGAQDLAGFLARAFAAVEVPAAISVDAFLDAEAFKREVDLHLARLKAGETLPGFDRVRIPGDRRDAIYRERRELGIPLHPNLVRALAAIAEELGIEPLAWDGRDGRGTPKERGALSIWRRLP